MCTTVTLVSMSGKMQATCQYATLTHGTHSITAHYNADGDFLAGDSSAITQVVNTPHLTLALVNNVAGNTTFPTGWNWQLTASNTGDGAATFGAGQTILQDDLPSADLTFGTVNVPAGVMSGITGGANISCSINGSKTLSCTALSGPVTIAAGTGSFEVVIPVSPNAGGSYTNPRTGGGICRIDPGTVIPQSDRSGSDCSPN